MKSQIRQSSNFFKRTNVSFPDKADKGEFQSTSYLKEAGGGVIYKNTIRVRKNEGAGIEVSIRKHGEKRDVELYCELGKDELELLLEYIESIKDEMKNYSGEIVMQKQD